MNLKKLTLAAVILAVLAGLTLWVKAPERRMGPLDNPTPARELDLDLVYGVEIEAPEETVQLRRGKENDWTVESMLAYPLDARQLQDLLLKIQQIRLSRAVTSKADHHGRFKLLDPKGEEGEKKEKGTKIILLDKESKSLFEIVLGEPRTSVGGATGMGDAGQYVRLMGSPAVYLMKNRLTVASKPERWLLKELLDVKLDEVARVEIRSPQAKPLIFTRGKDAEWELEGLQDDEKLKIPAVKGVARSLERFNLRSLSLSNQDLDESRSLRLKTFEGMTYSVRLGEPLAEGEKQILARVDVVAAEDAEDSVKKKAKELHHRLAPWTFLLDAYQLKRLIKPRGDLVEKRATEPPAEAGKIAAPPLSGKDAAPGEGPSPGPSPPGQE